MGKEGDINQSEGGILNRADQTEGRQDGGLEKIKMVMRVGDITTAEVKGITEDIKPLEKFIPEEEVKKEVSEETIPASLIVKSESDTTSSAKLDSTDGTVSDSISSQNSHPMDVQGSVFSEKMSGNHATTSPFDFSTLEGGRLFEPNVNYLKRRRLSKPEDKVKRPKFSRWRHKEYQCDECNRMFTLKHNLQNHFIQYHMGCQTLKKAPVMVKCEVCHKMYSSQSVLNSHLQNIHQVEPVAKHHCNSCPEKFLSASMLKRHVKSDHSSPLKTCPFQMNGCSHPGFRFVKDLNAHIQKFHSSKDKAPKYSCPVCDHKFSRVREMRVHEKKHMVSIMKEANQIAKESGTVKQESIGVEEVSAYIEKADLDKPAGEVEIKVEVPTSPTPTPAPPKVSKNIEGKPVGRDFKPELEAIPIRRKVAPRLSREAILAKIK